MANHNVEFSMAFAAALADLGVAGACLSPGSRNAPLIAAFAAEKRIEKWPILDERSAGFFALGLARATGKPAVLACTSGTAAAEYHAAVVEARHSNLPLIVLTADRPPELRGVGAPQSVDQIALYGTSTVLFRDLPPPGDPEATVDPREVAAEAVASATSFPPGPVHLNLPFREPLLGGTVPVAMQPSTLRLRQDRQPPRLGDWATEIGGRRGLIVAGRSDEPEFADAILRLSHTSGFPVLADPLSGLRFGDREHGLVLNYGDVLATAGALDKLIPEIVLRFGPILTSKPAWQWLEKHPEITQLLAEASGQDAIRSATDTIIGSPAETAAALADQLSELCPPDWTAAWRQYDLLAGQVVSRILDEVDFPNEPAIARTVVESCPPQTMITVGSSMPIRDIDAFGGVSSREIAVFGNRGANGIDGLVSAALGTAASNRPAVALVGDISLFHDLNALGTMAQLALPLTVVVVNNDGGGIFHFLPHADPSIMDPDTFETFLGTAHGTNFVAVGKALGIDSHLVEDRDTLAALLRNSTTKPRLLELRTTRNTNRELHRTIAAAVAAALE